MDGSTQPGITPPSSSSLDSNRQADGVHTKKLSGGPTISYDPNAKTLFYDLPFAHRSSSTHLQEQDPIAAFLHDYSSASSDRSGHSSSSGHAQGDHVHSHSPLYAGRQEGSPAPVAGRGAFAGTPHSPFQGYNAGQYVQPQPQYPWAASPHLAPPQTAPAHYAQHGAAATANNAQMLASPHSSHSTVSGRQGHHPYLQGAQPAPFGAAQPPLVAPPSGMYAPKYQVPYAQGVPPANQPPMAQAPPLAPPLAQAPPAQALPPHVPPAQAPPAQAPPAQAPPAHMFAAQAPHPAFAPQYVQQPDLLSPANAYGSPTFASHQAAAHQSSPYDHPTHDQWQRQQQQQQPPLATDPQRQGYGPHNQLAEGLLFQDGQSDGTQSQGGHSRGSRSSIPRSARNSIGHAPAGHANPPRSATSHAKTSHAKDAGPPHESPRPPQASERQASERQASERQASERQASERQASERQAPERHAGGSYNQGTSARAPSAASSYADDHDKPVVLEASAAKGMHSKPPLYKELEIPFRTLNSGHICPGIGYGTGGEGRATPEELYDALRVAIDCGFRSFDSAPFYQDGLVEQTIGRAIHDCGIPRSEFFITTKVWPTYARVPEESLDLSLKNMNFDYVDCLLMHWPIPLRPVPGEPYAMGSTWDAGWSFNKGWVKMQEIPSAKVRSIGVCNFTINRLRLLLASPSTKVVPAVLQVEGHPELPQIPLMNFCREHKIQVFCFSPLAQGQVSNPIIRQVAQKHSINSGQVALSWAIQRGTVPLPKSVNAERIRSNMQLVCLDADDFERLDTLRRFPRRIVNPKILFGHDIFENNADSYELEETTGAADEDEDEIAQALPRKRKA